MNQALRRQLIVGLAPLCVLALVVRAQEAAPPPASEAPAPAKEEATSVQPKDDPAKTNDTTPAAAEAPAPSKDENAAAAKESLPVKDESSAANSAPAPAPAAPVAAEATPVAPEPVKPAQETVAQVPPAAPAPAPEAPAATPAAPEPVKPAETTVVAAAPAPAPDVAPVAATVTPPPAVAETASPAVKETPAPSADATSVATAAPVAAEAAPTPALAPAAPEATNAPAASEPVKPAQETVAQVVPAAPASAPEVAAATPTPAPAVSEPVKPAEVTAVVATPAPAPDVTPVVATVIPPAAVAAPVTETVAPAVKETPAVATATPVAAEAAPAVPEPVIPAQETVAQVPPAVTAPAPEVPAATPAPAPVASEAANETVTPVAAANSGVAVDHFEFSYGLAHPALPELTQLQSLTIKTTRDGNVFRGTSAGKGETLSMGGIPEGSRFDADALRNVAQEVVRWYNSRGLYGVWVAYSDLESSAAGLIDNRPADSRAARIVIWASQVSQVRTLARGKRIKAELSINNRKHRRIINSSPLHPGKTEDQPGSLFNQEVLNNYLYGLSLHPGRRVEASIASAGQPGKVVLDYLVNESKAWQLFSQVNNFGTKETGVFRARVGYQDNQLTNHDDILNVDVIGTTDFKTYGSFLSYRFPLWRPDRLLMRVYASYGDFAATPTDTSNLSGLHYTGKNWQEGIEFSNRLTLWRDWQLVSVVGVNYDHYSFNQLYNKLQYTGAYSNFLVPFLSATVSKDSAWWSFSGGLRFDHTIGNYANPDPTKGYKSMGRQDPDPDWTSARWNLNSTVFLDHWLQHNDQPLALVHEFSARLKGRQLLRGKRLISQEEEPMGGALSVRGYPESVVSADEFITGSIEYAYHIPRGWKPTESGTLFRRPFKWHPTKAGQNPDWDLAVRTFFDYGYRGVNLAPVSSSSTSTSATTASTDNKLSFQDTNFNLGGIGLGVSLAVKQNFSLRCDFGMALTELRDDSRPKEEQVISPKGNKQVYVVSTFIW